MSPLYKYQAEGIERLHLIITSREERAAMLCDPPGAGKTPQAIGLLNKLGCKSGIILCPASLKENWRREIQQWSKEPLNVQILNSSSDEITGDILILSYQLMLRLADKLSKTRRDMLIMDESHICKSASSQVSRISLVTLWSVCTFRLLITGTPLPNGRAVEAYTTFSRCNKEHFGSWDNFKKRYCVEETTRWGTTYPYSKNLDELRKHSECFMVRRKKEEVLGQLPGLVRQNVYLNLPELEVFEAESGIDVDGILDAIENGVPLESDAISTVRRKIAALKAPLVVEAINDSLSEVEQLVVFVHHRELFDHLINSFSSIVGINGLTPASERQYKVDTFQKGDVQIFLASLKAANTGLTLTKASTLIMAEYDWVPSTNEQAEGRIYRVSQNEICRVKYLVASNTLDEKVLKIIQRKQKNIREALINS
jgi:SWI/SNF-related matrix-associated actin-dependent regulator 1 of chromatin subfamily A